MVSSIVADRGGEGGIRTLGTLRYTRFLIVHLRPLGHLSNEIMFGHRGTRDGHPLGPYTGRSNLRNAWFTPEAPTPRPQTRPVLRPTHRVHDQKIRRGGDSNSRGFRLPDFESGTFDHSDTPPENMLGQDLGRLVHACGSHNPSEQTPALRIAHRVLGYLRRSSPKNCRSSAAHSSARTPPTTSTRWLRRGSEQI